MPRPMSAGGAWSRGRLPVRPLPGTAGSGGRRAGEGAGEGVEVEGHRGDGFDGAVQGDEFASEGGFLGGEHDVEDVVADGAVGAVVAALVDRARHLQHAEAAPGDRAALFDLDPLLFRGEVRERFGGLVQGCDVGDAAAEGVRVGEDQGDVGTADLDDAVPEQRGVEAEQALRLLATPEWKSVE